MRMRYLVAGSLLIVGMVAMVQAQFGRGGGFGGPTALVTQKAVQEDLKMTEEQVSKVNDWSKDQFGKRFEAMKDAGIDFKTQEGREKLAELNAKLDSEAYKQLGDILKKDQIDRLKQIDRQRAGVRSFMNPEVADALKLTDSQKTSIKGITGDFDKERREIMQDAFKDRPKGKGKGGFGRLDPEIQKKIDKLQKEEMAKVVDLLDDSQKKTWKELTGTPFDFSKLTAPTFGGFGKGKNRKKDEE